MALIRKGFVLFRLGEFSRKTGGKVCMMTIETFKILCKIAKSYPYKSKGGIKCFTTIHDGSVFINQSNNGKRIQDYKEGLFWAMDWEAAGANINNLKTEFPALAAEHKVSSIDNIRMDKVCDEIDLIIVDKYNCPKCDIVDLVKQRTQSTLLNVLRELSKYCEWSGIEDGNPYTIWATQAEIVVLGLQATKKRKLSYTFNGEIKEFGEGDHLIGYMATIKVCYCKTGWETFDYSKESNKVVGSTSCESC